MAKRYTCCVCGEPTNKPISAAFEHFWFYHPGQWQYWKGNMRTFGFWGGLLGSLCLSFPFINTLANWKYRKHRLVIPGKSDEA